MWFMEGDEEEKNFRKEAEKSARRKGGKLMPKNLFVMSFGEFIDKMCVVSKKALCKLPGAQQELDMMLEDCKNVGIDGKFILAIIRLAQTNLSIWDLEHSVRNAAEGSIPLSEVGRRAIMIRNTNKTRIENKNILDRGHRVEEKIKHLSEDTYDKFYKAIGVTYVAQTREEGGQGE